MLNGQFSDWGDVRAGVPQGSILGPLLFLIYVNDIVDVVNSKIHLYADDITLYIEVTDSTEAARNLNFDLENINNWANKWHVTFNLSKSQNMIISRKKVPSNHPQIILSNSAIATVKEHRHLGLNLRNDLSWSSHISSLVEKSTKLINILRSYQYRLSRNTIETIYFSFIRPILEYGNVVWDGCTRTEELLLERVQLSAARAVTGGMWGTPSHQLYAETGWETLKQRREKRKLLIMFKIMNKEVPSYLSDDIAEEVESRNNYNTRFKENITHFRARTTMFSNSFFPSTIRIWNQIPLHVRRAEHISFFEKYLNEKYKLPEKYKFYSFGNRHTSILHSRLRMGCSQLNLHLHKVGLRESGNCDCGDGSEDTLHYFFLCRKFNSIRIDLHESVIRLAPFTLKTILMGSDECSKSENEKIFRAVFTFIEKSGRFN